MEYKSVVIKWLSAGHVSVPLLLLENYNKLKVNEMETMLLIHLHSYIESGITFPTPEAIAKRMTCSVEQCCDILRKLVQQGFIAIEDHENDVRSEKYSLLPLWEKLFGLLHEENKVVEQKEQVELEESLYSLFEREFARPLSPMECETLSMWIDQDDHSNELITLALREAVISGKMNFRYIDRILFEWKRNGIKNAQQASEYGKKFRTYQKGKIEMKPSSQSNHTEKDKPSTPFYHWLEKP